MDSPAKRAVLGCLIGSMAAFSIVGIVRSVSLGRPLRLPWRVLAFVLFAALQVAVMWISFLEPIDNR